VGWRERKNCNSSAFFAREEDDGQKTKRCLGGGVVGPVKLRKKGGKGTDTDEKGEFNVVTNSPYDVRRRLGQAKPTGGGNSPG